MIVFGSVECTTDAYDLMKSTVMPMVKKQLKELQESAVVTVYQRTNITKVFRSYTVPSTIHPGTIAFLEGTIEGTNDLVTRMTFGHGGGEAYTFASIDIDDPVFNGVQYFELGAKVVISKFNELFIGDLAFLAMLIGMTNSAGDHCLMCMLKGSEFNCSATDMTLRTKESIVECLEQYMLVTADAQKKNKPANYYGVNGAGLWDIDPQRILIPILHCPMGLVDKVLESFKQWVNLDVEDFNDVETEGTRSVYRLAIQQHKDGIVALEQAQELARANPTNVVAKRMEQEANKARIKLKAAESKARKVYDEQVQRHNAKKSSLNQKFENVFRKKGVKREHYHGGKFNGVNCIRIMEKCNSLFNGHGDNGTPGFIELCRLSKCPTMLEDTLVTKCNEYRSLMGLLDAIWSSVRGLDAGLLPTDEQKERLAEALKEGKALWLRMGLSTLQPKWHLTFDGHLLDQFTKYGGLADKSDESIEKGHQTLKALRNRFRGIPTYEQRETCIRRELRRGRSPEIQQHIDNFEAMIKQSSASKRAMDTAERKDNNKRAKLEKRGTFIALAQS